jgi:excisionase family DNA binding protein
MRNLTGDLDDQTHDRCDCHVCSTLCNVLSANLDATHDHRVVTALLLSFGQAAELLGIGEAAVRSLVSQGEIRAVTVQTYGRQRIPRVEIDEYVARLLTGQLRAWVEARRDLEQWGLRYMGDHRMYTDKNGRRSDRTVAWHLGDGKTTLCGKEPGGKWEVTAQGHWISRLCRDCEAIRDRRRLEKLERRRRPPLAPKSIQPMLTVVLYEGGESVRRVGWHLGDGRTTLCGITKDRWSLPVRRPRAKPCGVCQKTAGVETRGPTAGGVPPMADR